MLSGIPTNSLFNFLVFNLKEHLSEQQLVIGPKDLGAGTVWIFSGTESCKSSNSKVLVSFRISMSVSSGQMIFILAKSSRLEVLL